MTQKKYSGCTVQVAQMTDLHYCAKNLEESDRCFSAAVTAAIDRKVDCALITGDSTDHAMDAHSPAFVALAKQVQRLANHCPVLMLQGTFSHEPVGLLKILSMVGAKYPITIAEKISSFGLTESKGFELIVPGMAYRLVCTAIPTLNKADIAAMTNDSVGAAAEEAGRIVSDVLASLAPMNRALRLDGIPSMVISHGMVMNCLTEHGVPMAGFDHEFTVGSLFSALADAVALGHIHKHQSWESEMHGFPQTIAYGGSIGRFHYGEEDAKVWLQWHMSSGQASFTAHETPARRTIDIFFDGPPDMEKLRAAAAQCEGAFVRVRYEVDAEHKQSVDRNAIKAMLGSALHLQIEGTTLAIERVRAKGISTEPSLVGKLEKWCKATNTQVGYLPEMLTMIQNQDAQALVDSTMKRIMHKVMQGEVEPIDAVAEEPARIEVAPVQTPIVDFSEVTSMRDFFDDDLALQDHELF